MYKNNNKANNNNNKSLKKEQKQLVNMVFCKRHDCIQLRIDTYLVH